MLHGIGLYILLLAYVNSFKPQATDSTGVLHVHILEHELVWLELHEFEHELALFGFVASPKNLFPNFLLASQLENMYTLISRMCLGPSHVATAIVAEARPRSGF